MRTQNAHTLNLALYLVQSSSEQWSHYCSSGRKECLTARPFALVNPIAPPNLAGTPGRQQALATSVSIEGGCPSRGGSAAVEVPSPAVATGAGPVEADPPPTMGEDERRMEGGYVTDVDPDGRLGQHSCYETPAATWIETHDAARARGCWRSSHDGQLTVLYCVPTNPGPRSFRAWPVRRCHWRTP